MLKTNFIKRRHRDSGFTLIELLVVVAIIAVLVVLVVVAINPFQILRDSRDRAALANVRSSGVLIATCITKELEQKVALSVIFSVITNQGCGDITSGGKLSTYGTVPSVLDGSDAINIAGARNICTWVDNVAGTGRVKFRSMTNQITGPDPSITASCSDP